MSVEYLSLSNLFVDIRIQREPPTPSTVKRLTKNWDRKAVGVLVGSRREDGMISIIDGQGRWNAAKEIDPDFLIPVDVNEGLSLADEIDLFLKINENRKAVPSVDRLRVKMNSGLEPWESLKVLLETTGINLSKGAGLNSFNAAGTIEKIAKQENGIQILADAIHVIKTAHPYETDRWRSGFFNGVIICCRASMRVLGFDREKFVTVVGMRIPSVWEQVAAKESMKKGSATRSDGSVANVSRAIAEEYNKGRRNEAYKLKVFGSM